VVHFNRLDRQQDAAIVARHAGWVFLDSVAQGIQERQRSLVAQINVSPDFVLLHVRMFRTDIHLGDLLSEDVCVIVG